MVAVNVTKRLPANSQSTPFPNTTPPKVGARDSGGVVSSGPDARSAYISDVRARRNSAIEEASTVCSSNMESTKAMASAGVPL